MLDGTLGACHGLEIPFVFNTLDTPVVKDLTGGDPEAITLSKKMGDAI